MKYKIVTERNGLKEITYVPMMSDGKVWYPFLDAQKKMKRFLGMEAAQTYIDNQHRKHLAAEYEVVSELHYIPGATHGAA